MSTEFVVGDIVRVKTWDELVKNDANIPDSYQEYVGKLCLIHRINGDRLAPRFILQPLTERDPIEDYFIPGDFEFISFSYLSKSLGNITLIHASQAAAPAHETRLELKGNA